MVMEDHQKERRKRNSELFRMKINTAKTLAQVKNKYYICKRKITKVLNQIV